MDCFPDQEVLGGAPLNVAYHLRGLGGGVGVIPVLVTRIGKDEHGHRLLEAMHAAGLPIDGVQLDCLHPTGAVRIELEADGQGHRFEIAPDQAWDFIHADMARLVGLSSRPQWLYFGTLAQRAAPRPIARPAAHPALRSLMQTTPKIVYKFSDNASVVASEWYAFIGSVWVVYYNPAGYATQIIIIPQEIQFGFGGGVPF